MSGRTGKFVRKIYHHAQILGLLPYVDSDAIIFDQTFPKRVMESPSLFATLCSIKVVSPTSSFFVTNGCLQEMRAEARYSSRFLSQNPLKRIYIGIVHVK